MTPTKLGCRRLITSASWTSLSSQPSAHSTGESMKRHHILRCPHVVHVHAGFVLPGMMACRPVPVAYSWVSLHPATLAKSRAHTAVIDRSCVSCPSTACTNVTGRLPGSIS